MTAGPLPRWDVHLTNGPTRVRPEYGGIAHRQPLAADE